jgi:hypothetical protein
MAWYTRVLRLCTGARSCTHFLQIEPRLVDHLLAVEAVLDHQLSELEQLDEVRVGVLGGVRPE